MVGPFLLLRLPKLVFLAPALRYLNPFKRHFQILEVFSHNPEIGQSSMDHDDLQLIDTNNLVQCPRMRKHYSLVNSIVGTKLYSVARYLALIQNIR